jgi:hypothetical protein
MATLPNRIALVFDCDDTLAKDTTAWLLQELGANPDEIFKEAGTMIRNGWDPPLAYLNIILKETRDNGKLTAFNRSKLTELAKNSKNIFYPGTDNLFERLRSAVRADKRYRDLGIQVNFYIITGWIEEFVRETQVGKTADEVWGSSFDYDAAGKPIAIKNAISFTEKSRYLFCINKGVTGSARNSPYKVNSSEPDREQRSVPFSNMIYVGDGPSDIPCMSIVTQYKGKAIGILSKKTKRVWELGEGRRVDLMIPADYREGEIGYLNLRRVVLEVAESIHRKWEYQRPPTPEYGFEGENNGA